MTVFRPCIDLHQGRVKQIVGGSLTAHQDPQTHFVAGEPPEYFARLYRRDDLPGGHVIMLGPGNEAAARAALAAWPGGLQVGGGMSPDNASNWLAAGAEKIIVTSWLFEGEALSTERLKRLSMEVPRDRLVIDLSCRKTPNGYYVAKDRWQTLTTARIERPLLEHLAEYCSEILVHAADVEGLCRGIDEELVQQLAAECPLPCTYAGGARDIADLDRVAELSAERIDLTFGSGLDLFGGSLVRYSDCVQYNHEKRGRLRTSDD